MAAGLGVVNIVLALVLGSFLRNGAIAAQLGGIVAFAGSIYWLLLGYGILYLLIPLVRYFWLQTRNPQIITRNQAREQRAIALGQPSSSLRQKIAYASNFAQQKVIGDRDITYTTEDDLLDQNLKNAEEIDREWQQRLESGS
jgi:thiosulfate reductase cytochrome b subunit